MALDFMTQRSLLIEIGQSSLKAFDGNSGLELPLERLESGPLTHSCKENLTSALRRFLQRKNWTQRQRAICAIGARGVSLRRLVLPVSSKDELQRLLLLQIESEFPLAPEELAWGYCKTGNESPSLTDASRSQELVVVAVKKEVLEEYSEILSGCGLNAIFTLAALARNAICPHPSSPYAILDIGRDQSELISFENGAPSAVRILRWGGEDITDSIATKLGIGHGEAEKLKIDLEHASLSNAELGQQMQDCIRSELDSLARLIQRNWTGQKLYLTGKTTRLKEISPFLSEALGGGAQCERIESTAGEGRSAAVLGLKRLEQEENGPPLIFQLKKIRNVESTKEAPPGPRLIERAAGICPSMNREGSERGRPQPQPARVFQTAAAGDSRVPLPSN